MRKPADKVTAPVLLDNPVLSHADIIPKLGYCINKLTLHSLFIPPVVDTPSLNRAPTVASAGIFGPKAASAKSADGAKAETAMTDIKRMFLIFMPL